MVSESYNEEVNIKKSKKVIYCTRNNNSACFVCMRNYRSYIFN